jgi:hypothetical protein
MTKAFNFDLDSAKKAAQASKEKGSSTKIKRLKLKEETTGILLLPPLAGKPFIKEVSHHEYWSQKEKKFLVQVGSPAMHGEKDIIMEEGWKYRDKYKDSSNKKLKDLWKIFMPRNHKFVNCINIKAIEEGPMVLDLPLIVYNTVTDELAEMEEASDMMTICDLDKGRILKIKHNGGEGIAKKYEVVKFMNKSANLVEDGKVEVEEVLNSMADLDRLELPCDDKKIQEALVALKKIARSIEEKETEEMVDENDNSEFDDDVKESKTASDEEEFEL